MPPRLFVRALRWIACANQKGGVGKTALTLGLASALIAKGMRVLLVDCDPQGNATTGVGVIVQDDQKTMYNLLAESVPGSAASAIVPSAWRNLDIIPATMALANSETDGANDLVFRLDVAFQGVDLSAYDAILFDCPPSLGKILFSVLMLDGIEVIAVTEPTVDSVKGVENLSDTMRKVQARPNPTLKFRSIVISQRRNTGEHNFREAELRSYWGTLGNASGLVARTVIPALAARQDAHSSRKPIHEFRGGNAMALQVSHDDLAVELGLLQGKVS